MNSGFPRDFQEITEVFPDLERLRGSSILITGANGFLPAYMVDTLVELNRRDPSFQVRVSGLVRNIAKARARFGGIGEREGLTLVEGDVTTFRSTETYEYVIHAASQASPKYYGSDPVGTFLPNVVGTHHLLEHCRVTGVRKFLFFSSSEVYGEFPPEKSQIGEMDFGPLNPALVRSCYGEGKRAGETLCMAYHHQFRIPVTIVRPFHTYGPGMSLTDGRIFAEVVAAVVEKRDIVLNSDGSALRAFCYLSDAVRAFFLALFHGQSGMTYNVGNPNAEVSIKDLAERVAGLYPERGVKVRVKADANEAGYLRSAVSRNRPDIARMTALGWQPGIGIEAGFRRTIEWYL